MTLRLRLGNKEDYMKLKYEKPLLEIENYELDSSIASNCSLVVNSGPKHPEHDPCSEYYEIIGMPMPATTYSSRYNIDFYDDCDCYYSASGYFFTS